MLIIPSMGLRQSSSIREVVPQTSEQSKTITVKAPLSEGRGLIPGIYGTLTFPTTSSQLIAVPSNAVKTFGQLETVRVLQDGLLKSRYVKTGRKLDDGRTEILSGLDPGGQVAVE